MNFNWKYFIYDLFKVGVPILVGALLPETAPQVEIISVALYIFAAVLGIDAIKKTAVSLKK